MSGDLQIPLAEAIRALRREVVEAVREGRGEDVLFALGPIELELLVEASLEQGAEGGIKFWLISAGADASRSRKTTHTLRLSLRALHADGSDVVVQSEIAG